MGSLYPSTDGLFNSKYTAQNPSLYLGLRGAKRIPPLKILSNPSEANEKMGRIVGNGGGFSTSIIQISKQLLPTWDEDEIERTWQELYDARIHRTDGVRTMITDKGIHQLENRLTDYGVKVVRYLKETV